jgi:putative polymerase
MRAASADFGAAIHDTGEGHSPATAMWPVAFATFRNQWTPALVVTATVILNAVLAVVNGHAVPLTQSAVIVGEVLLVVAAHVTAIMNYQPQMKRWYVLIGIMFVIALVRGLVMQDFDPKLLRDVLLIPTFILLGITFRPYGLPTLIVVLVGIVAAFMLLEAIDTASYAWVFKIQDFYINTRGFTEATFWNKDLPLFASATRPDGRFINIVELHRLSSIFLEPVGSETFCIVLWTFICSCYDRLSRKVLIGLVIAYVLMVVGSDGRLALVMSGIILALCTVAPRLPWALPLLYLPVIATGVAILVYSAGLQYDADNFSGRIAFSTHLLAGFDVADLLGASNTMLGLAADAGLAYLILSQSVFGVIILWGFLSMGSRRDTPAQIRYYQSTCLWLALFMMVGAAFLTIKTAGLLWFIFGSLQRDEPAPAPLQNRLGIRGPSSRQADSRYSSPLQLSPARRPARNSPRLRWI